MADRPHAHRRLILRTAFTLVTAFLGVHLLLPQLAGLDDVARQLARATWWLPLAALALEAASFATYGELTTGAMRSQGQRVRRSLMQRASVSSTALGKALPGGAAAALAIMLRALRDQGLEATRSASALATAGVIWLTSMVLLLPVGAALALAGGELGSMALGGIGAGVAVLLGLALLLFAVRRPDATGRKTGRFVAWLARGPIRRWIDPGEVERAVTDGLRSAAGVARNRRALAASLALATANLLLDFAVLLVLAITIGHGTPLWPLLLVYAIGMLVATVPITPGGVGIVEATMIGALVAVGAPAAAATSAVLGWRLVSHWLPIAVGLALLPTLLRSGKGDGQVARPRAAALR
jgi:uncharacterized protein (TIRG00374 family)